MMVSKVHSSAANAKQHGANYRCCSQCYQEEDFQRWSECLGAARIEEKCQDSDTIDVPRGFSRSHRSLFSPPFCPSLLGYSRKMPEVTLSITDRIQG